MDWSERMNAAVDYIEENLAGEVDFNKAADKACCSLFHFCRMFHAINEVTPADYVRSRRLTLAAAELSHGKVRTIDVAMKYGYDSPNAFTRAFRRMHGISPRSVRVSGVNLAALSRLRFDITSAGGNIMNYRIIEKPAFEIIGRGESFGVANGEFQEQGRSFWRKFVATEEYKTLAGLTGARPGPLTMAPVLTAYLPNKNGTWDPVLNVFGVEKTEGMIPEGFQVYQIPSAVYAEFDCTFKTSTATNKRIYSEWFPATGYERDDKADIALFFQAPWSREIFVRWWTPIIKK